MLSLRKVFVNIEILFRIRIRIRIMILLWISIPDLHFIHRRHPPNFVWWVSSSNSFKSYCVHMKSPRTYVHPDRQTDGQTEIFFLLVLSSKIYKSWTLVKRREFFFHSCDYNTFSFYILRMWWESKNKKKNKLVVVWNKLQIQGKSAIDRK